MNTYVKNTALLGILTVFTLFIIIWANLVELDEMSRVQGKIIPSSKEKVIQSEFNGRLVKIGLKVQGSALANASASLLFSELKELSLPDAQKIHERILKVLLEGKTIELPGDLCVFNSIVRFPERHDCALLAWNALGEALSF